MEESSIKRKTIQDLLNMYANEMGADVAPKITRFRKPDGEQRLRKLMTHRDLTKTTKRTIPLNGCRNNLVEEKQLSYNDNVSATDDKVEVCKKLMKSLLCSIHSEDQHSCGYDHISSGLNTQRNPVGNKPVYLIGEDILEESYLNENQDTTHVPHCADKMTYCRPVINIYSQEVINKAKRRNEKLLLLVKKLVQAREKEKRNEAWNNYINEIKNKHGYYDYQSSKIPESLATEDESPIIIDEFYKSRGPLRKSNLCGNLLKDFYKTSSVENFYESLAHRSYNYENNSFCFPNFSQEGLIMSNRKLINGNYRDFLPTKRTREKSTSTLVENTPLKKNLLKINKSSQILDHEKQVEEFKNIEEQNKDNNHCCKESQISDEDKCTNVPDNQQKNENILKQCLTETKQCSLSNIENKLDVLLHSLNSFLDELKAKKVCVNVTSATSSQCTMDRPSDGCKAKSDTYNALDNKHFICGVTKEKPGKLDFPNKRQNTIDEILTEEMDKSNKVKRDIQNILCNTESQCGFKITIDIPTKDHSNEVKNSLNMEKHHEVIGEESERTGKSGGMTIAVNTDPLGLLALFQVSAETMKQVLSYMPRVDYVSYLSRLPAISGPPTAAVSGFTCHICGSSFDRPSQLSDHIQEHDLGSPRNCCICRRVLDMKCHRAGLFACQHCGQLFTRAYCRELHQQACCMANGRHDVAPDLMMLS